MKFIFVSSIVSAVLIIAACHSTKKTTTSTSTSSVSSTTTTTVESITIASAAAKPEDGIYAPDDEELSAVNVTYKDVTLNKLKVGYELYAGTTCTRCHRALNIYNIPPDRWPQILETMAYKAGINAEQKDAVFKYVLAIKAAKK